MARLVSELKGVRVVALDGQGKGGEHSKYELAYGSEGLLCRLRFQAGTVPEVGVNGVTDESLLDVLIDRYNSFQEGPYACQQNADCLACLQAAKLWMQARTLERESRGVEGKHEV